MSGKTIFDLRDDWRKRGEKVIELEASLGAAQARLNLIEEAGRRNLFLIPNWVPGFRDPQPRDGWSVYDDAVKLHADLLDMPGNDRALAVGKTLEEAIEKALSALEEKEKHGKQ